MINYCVPLPALNSQVAPQSQHIVYDAEEEEVLELEADDPKAHSCRELFNALDLDSDGRVSHPMHSTVASQLLQRVTYMSRQKFKIQFIMENIVGHTRPQFVSRVPARKKITVCWGDRSVSN